MYPSLATVDPDRFGICVANTKGLTAIAGDADVGAGGGSVGSPTSTADHSTEPPTINPVTR